MTWSSRYIHGIGLHSYTGMTEPLKLFTLAFWFKDLFLWLGSYQ